ncbi:protein argonaute-2 [Anopheles cruzii]|uniref:protein argonaute-2 n=1 Tax=Anopheles cruzii TaxID=68878 RepID=UPI0022EC5AB8|nr:protein argonaute-2 [Anopheles cruzii]
MGRKKGKNTGPEESNPDKSQQDPQKQQQQGGATQPKEQQQAGPSQPKEQKQQKQQSGPNQPKEQQQVGPSQPKEQKEHKQQKQQGGPNQPKEQKQQKQQGGPNQPKEQKQQKQQGGPSQPKEQQQGGQSQYHQGQQSQGPWNQPGQQQHQGQRPQGPWNQPGQQPQGPWNQPGQQPQGPWNQPGPQQHQGQRPPGPWNQPGQQPQGPFNQPGPQQHQGQRPPGPWNQPGQQPQGTPGQQPQGPFNQPGPQQHQGQRPPGPWNQPGQQPQGPWNQPGQQPPGPWNQPGQQPQGPWNQPGQQSQGAWNQPGQQSQGPWNQPGQQQQQQQQGSQGPLSQTGQPQSSPRAPPEKKGKPGGGDSPAGRTPSVASTKSSSSGDGVLPSLPEDLSNMQVSKQKVHRTNLRPVLYRSGAHGKRGKPVTVEVNFFRMLIDKLKGIAFHYDVTIEPDRPKKFFRPVFAQFCQETYPNVRFAFDGQKSAYTAHKVDDSRATVTFHPSDRGKEMQFKVTVKLAATVDLGSLRDYMQSNIGSMDKPMAAIQCLDVVLRCAYEGNDRFVRFKRSVYEVPRNRIDLGKGHELWYGLFQSAILGSKPYVNVDVSHKAFPSSGPLVDIFASFNRGNLDTNRPLDGWLVKELHDYVRGMDILYRSPNGTEKRMRCNGLRDAANAQQFTLDDGTKLTVADYFSRKLNYKLRYPSLPVVHVGSSVRNVFVPPELCQVPPGQALNKTHPDECTAKIIRFAATSVQERKEKIMRLSTSIAYNNSPTLIDFGVGVGKEFEKLSARIIDPPTVVYAGNDQVRPTRGVWRAEGKRFTEPSSTVAKKTLCWRILNLDGYTNETMVKEFGEQIYNHARKCDVQLEPFSMQTTFVLVRNPRDAVRDLSQLLSNIKKDQPAITIVIIPSRGDVYAKVKQKAELASERIGLLTQCIKDQTVKYKRTDGSTINNILLKINAKTNGSNHRLTPETQPPLAKGRVMYIGADVTHPTGDDIPSVVGVTSVYDLHGFRYNCSVRLQGPRDEMIRDLENIVHRHVQLYQKYNGNLPERIMYYRDGVSDGQFAEILTIEMQAIHAALARIGANFKPPVTFIVVQKRHHTRFFPVGNCPTEGKNGNVPPGTVVDRDITAPNRFEFYLVSHAAVQGVAKPTKYVVLYDDSKCDPDQLQAMTLNLCYMFARCNRAVSYPAPTYYAHHAAFRGRVYLKNRRINMNDLEAAYRDIQISAEVHEKNPMFFV